MQKRIIKKEHMARAVRMLLVFALVFWSSFRVECLAFAAINTDPLAGHENDTLANLEIWQVADPDNIDWANAGKEDLKQRVAVAKLAEGEAFEAPAVRVAAQGRLQFVVVPDWGGNLTVTYTDGVDDEEVFPDDVHKNLTKGSTTPTFELAEGSDGKREGYSFTGWKDDKDKTWPYDADKGYAPVAETVEEDTVYTAQWEGNEHTVTFEGPDGEVLRTDQVRYGESMPDPPDQKVDWYDQDGDAFPADKTLRKDKDLTYKTDKAETYTITWLDSDGSPLGTETVEKGTVPSREGPSRQDDVQYTYAFDRWDPAPYAADRDQEYTAVYSQSPRSYLVTWYNGFGGELASGYWEYGQTPEYPGTPTYEDDGYTYEFDHWDPAPSTVDGEASYTAVWNATKKDEPVEQGSGEDQKLDEGQQMSPQSAQNVQQSVGKASPARFAAGVFRALTQPTPAYAAEGDDANTVLVATDDLLEWEVKPVDDSASAEIAFENGVATLTGRSPGKVEVTCKLKDAANAATAYQLPEGMTPADFEMKFEVTVVYVSSLEIYRADTGKLVGGAVGEEVPPEGDGSKEHPLQLTDEQKAGFGLTAKANVSTGAGGQGPETFESSPGSPLSKSSDRLLSDLKWSVLDGDLKEVDPAVASITQDGVLSVAAGEGAPSKLAVRCTSANGENGEYSEYVYFGDWSQDLLQGEDRHQDELTVVVQSPKLRPDGTPYGAEETSSGSAEAVESSEAADTPPAEGETDAAADNSQDSEPPTAEETAEEAKNYIETKSVYDKDLKNAATGKQLDRNSKTYTMTLPTGAHPEGQAVSVAGFGTTLSLLLDDAGVPLEKQKNIDYLEFTNAEAITTRVSWADLVNASHAEASYVIVATQATVLGALGEGGAESGGAAQAGADTTKLLDNTRYQVMFDQSDAAPALTEAMAALRWVNTITVRMKGVAEEEGDEGLRPTINYTPVPKGYTAFLTVVPTESVGSKNFSYKWERWTEKTGAWEEVATNIEQTIHVPTDDEHIGNFYRVSVIMDDSTSKPSKPAQIKEGTGLVVQLDYQPPFAGDWANFTSHIIGADENDPNITYRWEQSTDGCKTWTVIPNETGKTLRVKTNPVSPGASSSGSGGATVLTYIRVVATLGSQSGVSGPQLLTVQVGDNPDGHDSTENDGNDVPANSGGSENPSGDAEDPDAEDLTIEDEGDFEDEDDFGDEGDDDFEDEGDFEGDVEDDFADGDDEAEQEDEPAGAPQVAPTQELPETFKPIDESQIIVSEDVSKKIADQNKTDDSKVPGARWTKISATPKPDEVRHVLAANPFAPLAAPFALGLTTAGLVEKLLAFRRQMK